MNNEEPIIQLPRISKKWKRKITSQDISPNIHKLDSSDQKNFQNQSATCEICEKNEARYTCPRCQVPYCSVACYKNHNAKDSDQLCTEAFYRDRVFDMMRNEYKDPENTKTMKRILQRTHAERDNATSILEKQYGENDSITAFQDEKLEEDFMDLAQHLLSLRINPGHDNRNNNHPDMKEVDLELKQESEIDEQTEELLYQTLQSKPLLLKRFEEAVAKGELSHYITIWQPWWMPSNPVYNTEKNHSQPLPFESDNKSTKQVKTLDEQIIATPKFHSLFSSNQKLQQNIPKLQFNALHLLYTISQTLRLCNGNDDKKSQKSLEIVTVFFSISTVLNQDARYATVEEVLLDCITESTKEFKRFSNGTKGTSSGNCNVTWNVLVQDLLCLVSNKRFVFKALFTAKDIIQNGVRALRQILKQSSKTTLTQGSNEINNKACADHLESDLRVKSKESFLKDLRHAKKKIEFYTSWCIANWSVFNLEESLSKDIQDWIDHCEKYKGTDTLDPINVLSRLSLKSNSIKTGKMNRDVKISRVGSSNQTSNTLFHEVKTIRKSQKKSE